VWARPWPAGVVLAELVPSLPLRGRRVIELGCGLGTAGLAAARAGAHVTLTDEEPEALSLASANALRNGLSVQTRILVWGQVPADLCGRFDVVLGADVLYNPDAEAPLLATISALLAPGGEAWLASPDRGRPDVGPLAFLKVGPQLPTSDASEARPIRIVHLRS
jgi:predicted nicotinamide N-methyase